jgi:sugar lactone lactonase YvrE
MALRPWTAALVLASAAGLAGGDDRAALRAAQEQARAAYDKKDYGAFLEQSRLVARLAPRSTRALYNLACAQALTGHPAEAVALLERLARMGLALDPAQDTDFAALKDTPAFQAVTRRFAEAATPIEKSALAFTLPQRDLITEGIAYDPASGAFFVSSVHRRKILRVDPAGVARDFTTEGQDGLMAVLALAVDAPRRALWASSEGVKAMAGFTRDDDGRSFVYELDLGSGKLRRRLGPPASVPDGRLSDLTVSEAGDLFVSDPVGGRIYRLRAGEKELAVLVGPGPLGSPQGLALSADGRTLFVADYTQGIARVDTRTGAVALLDAPEDAALTGIDGLVRASGDLLGIQNGLRPHRLLRLRLDPAAQRVTAVEVLERAHRRWDEPTLGVLAGGDLYYVATSQYAAVGEDGTLAMDRLQPPVILRLPLAPR